MRVAVVEPYAGGSHLAWAEGYRDNSSHEVVVMGHDARFWKWRMHGSYVTLAEDFVTAVGEGGPFDVIVASDMLHLPAFLGTVGEALRGARVALYMHENQLTYPWSPRDSADEAYAMINWGSMAVADVVLFNSQFHLDVWFEHLPGLLKRFPDYRHSHLVSTVRAKSEVLTVGVDLGRIDSPPGDSGPPADPGGPSYEAGGPLILWNQRWDHDKGPGPFAAAMRRLAVDHDFRVALAGEKIGELEEFTALRRDLGDRVVQFGTALPSVYPSLLRSSDLVVSTARQEFFGVAVTEAVYAGAFPLLPKRLVYPERIPVEFHEACLYGDDELAERLAWALTHESTRREIVRGIRPVMAASDWSRVGPLYDNRLSRLSR